MNANYDLFTDRLKKVVTIIGSVAKTARKLSIAESTVRKWRDGASDPQLQFVIKLAKEAKVNLAWLASGEGEMGVVSKALTVGSSPSKSDKFNFLQAVNEKIKPTKIINGFAASLKQLMISEGLIEKSGDVAIKNFVYIYNQVCGTPGSNKDMQKTIIKYMISFQEEQLEAFRRELATGNVPDPVKAFEDVLKKGIEEKQQKLESLK